MTTMTRLFLNPQKRQGRRLLADPQAMHAAVRSAFPPDIDEDTTRVLWRVDSRQHEHVLYIVGPEQPDAAHLVEQAGWMTRPAQTADYSRLQSTLTLGQQWRFELTANPVRSKAGARGTRGSVVPLVSPDSQLAWLAGRSESAGFRILPYAGVPDGAEGITALDAAVVEQNTLRFERRKAEGKAGRHVSLRTARFTGNLEVTDVEALQRTLNQGLGRAKAYGCGLLTLARPGQDDVGT
jgi:CRISPR system Cascade subunit CasE